MSRLYNANLESEQILEGDLEVDDDGVVLNLADLPSIGVIHVVLLVNFVVIQLNLGVLPLYIVIDSRRDDLRLEDIQAAVRPSP